ncbi:hypothetical protein EDB83DRAFT_2323028 [Lactarius deliciosus]|nr:hypothetical protein EDB83DRAFT_2323028 [Lactarius deliciosus]
MEATTHVKHPNLIPVGLGNSQTDGTLSFRELPDGQNIEFLSMEASRHVKHPKLIPVGLDIIYKSPAAGELPDGRNIEFLSVEASRHVKHPKLIPMGLLQGNSQMDGTLSVRPLKQPDIGTGELPDGQNIEFPSIEASRHIKHPKLIPVGLDIIYKSQAAGELPDGRNIEFLSVEASRHVNHPKLIPVGLDVIYKSPAAGELLDGRNIEFLSVEASRHVKHLKLISVGLLQGNSQMDGTLSFRPLKQPDM